MMNPIIVEHVTKSYGSLQAVHDLSFTVPPSVCFGFLGPNGAGKTTMMKMIYGKCLRDKPSAGRISVFDFDPQTHELNIKFQSGVVPQEDNLDEELNVSQNLQVYARFYGMKQADASKRIEELLNFFELNEKRNARIRESSGGMKRRLVIARALLHTPRLLILDEPTTGLDPQVRHLIWEKLRQLKKEGLTILLTTHYMEEAFQLCDTILIMDSGKKIIEGKPGTLLTRHIEQFVLEIHDESDADDLGPYFSPDVIRRDQNQPRFFYSNDSDALKKLTEQLSHTHYYVRQANLEDLFLKLTGRALNAHQ